MRFLANGPAIPDEFLVARDEGRVVFFCGAGVSRARADLPNFYELAERVLAALEGGIDSTAKRLIQAARDLEHKSSVSGVVSADRIFSILQRDFEIRDVEAAVAKILKPPDGADLSAHRLLLDLARGPDGRTRLVTTNFELLFENAAPDLNRYTPVRLPDPERYDELDGIVHLHGRVNQDYSGAEGDGFVLSSAEFGRAYISHGWATRFISSILKKYLVVFVGYTADDPPVQYLLEALNREPGSSSGLFAFQAGSHTEAEGRWLHKGVEPIAYDDRDKHKALWESLEAWAARARDVEGWYGSVIAAAQKGPAKLLPHERGKVSHIVSTLEGARRFATYEKPAPAEWLCVFDRTTRFAPVGRIYSDTDEKTIIDPFEAYGLDSDPVPIRGDPDEPVPNRRELPAGAWDCFDLTRLDREGLPPGYLASFTGSRSALAATLVPRLAAIGAWMSKVSEQPAAVWWAAGRARLHPDVQRQIRSHLEREKTPSSSEVRKAWRFLFEAWESAPDIALRDWIELRPAITLDGWSSAVVRRFAAIQAPYLKVTRPLGYGPRPPLSAEGLKLRNLVSLDVEYPHLGTTPEIPDAYVRETVRAWRTLLERAVLMEREASPYALNHIASLAPEEQDGGLRGRHDLATPLIYYRDLFKRLIAVNAPAAREELQSWWQDDDTVFARLRIWASGEERLLSAPQAAQLLCDLSQKAFWAHGHQRDLLVVLARRWTSFPTELREQLAARLLGGPASYEDEEAARFEERRAWAILERIHWLRSQGCDLGFDVEHETTRLSPFAPRWKAEFAEEAAESLEPRIRSVQADSGYSELLSIPLNTVLARAQELSAQQDRQGNGKDPFAGLAGGRPVRALSALTLANKTQIDASWAWQTFLNVEARKNQEAKGKAVPTKAQLRFSKLIAKRLAQLPAQGVAQLLYPIADWLLTASERFPAEADLLESLWPKVIAALGAARMEESDTTVKEPDWATDALNSPAGKLAQALMAATNKANAEPAGGFDTVWLQRVEQLVSMPANVRRHALAIFSYNLVWFYARDPAWTEQHLLSALQNNEDERALLGGLLWSGRVPQPALYLRLKSAFLKLERQGWLSRHSHMEVLASIILAGWGSVSASGAPILSNDEMRTLLLKGSDDFRGQLLWLLKRWASEDPKWAAKLPQFFTDAWPRQKVIKSAKASVRLAELTFSNVQIFGAIADIVMGLVTTFERDHVALYDFIEKPETIVNQYPEKALALLARVLPVDVSRWPYRIEQVLDRIGVADPSLLKDGRLLELRRRWNAR